MNAFADVERALYWTPRVLVRLFALFMGAFALDTFQEALAPGEMALAFLIHLVPAFIVLATLGVAWRRELLGGVLFVALAVVYVVITRGRAEPLTYLLVAGPPVLVGVLFIAHHTLLSRRADRG